LDSSLVFGLLHLERVKAVGAEREMRKPRPDDYKDCYTAMDLLVEKLPKYIATLKDPKEIRYLEFVVRELEKMRLEPLDGKIH
jgi:hypothetical protein